MRQLLCAGQMVCMLIFVVAGSVLHRLRAMHVHGRIGVSALIALPIAHLLQRS